MSIVIRHRPNVSLDDVPGTKARPRVGNNTQVDPVANFKRFAIYCAALSGDDVGRRHRVDRVPT